MSFVAHEILNIVFPYYRITKTWRYILHASDSVHSDRNIFHHVSQFQATQHHNDSPPSCQEIAVANEIKYFSYLL